MAKDLFIFTLNSKGEFKRVKWEDVIEQRSTFQFLHPVDYSAFFENPFETFKDAILTKIKETMVEGN